MQIVKKELNKLNTFKKHHTVYILYKTTTISWNEVYVILTLWLVTIFQAIFKCVKPKMISNHNVWIDPNPICS